MPKQFLPPADYPPFANLPVRLMSGRDAALQIAVHVSGRFVPGLLPIVCLPDVTRNMSDYADFVRLYRFCASADWPIVLIDPAGHGRSSHHKKPDHYGTQPNAEIVADVLRALGISRAIFVGQGHGGQIVMSLSTHHLGLLAGAVLINSGPAAEPAGLVRMSSNLKHLQSIRGETPFTQSMRRILGAEYPSLPPEALDEIGQRTHFLQRNGQVVALYDPALLQMFADIQQDDVFEPQWHLFDALKNVPLMLMRTQLCDRLSAETLRAMAARRPDAAIERLPGEGSPALLNNEADVSAIAEFVRDVDAKERKFRL